MNQYTLISIDMEATGKRIKQLRKEKGLTIDYLAECFDSSYQSIYKWQSGQTLPTLDNAIRLSAIFKVPLEEIVILRKNIK